MSSAGRRCAVLGRPVHHSLSPVLHRAAYRHLGLTGWTYTAHEVDEAGLPGFVGGLDASWRGLSLTMPLKRAALAVADEVTPTARAVGAANTLLLDGTGRRLADNTDVPGLEAALRAAGVTGSRAGPRGATVLGGGATAASAVVALARLGVTQPTVLVRDPARAEGVLAAARASGSSPRLQPWGEAARHLQTGVVVATAPAGATDALAVALPAAARTAELPALLDVVYDPWPTTLAAAWTAAGGAVVGGLELLVQQAALQVRLFTGRAVPVSVLREAGERALRARAP